jgi:mannitol-1-phosphate/altronate dehydrogenase
MEHKPRILIYGAGAIGRGFLAPVFCNLGYEIFFVERNPKIMEHLRRRSSYKTAFSKHHSYKIEEVDYSGAFFPGEEEKILDKIDIVFSCVGPNNLGEAMTSRLKNVPAIVSFENEIESVDKIKNLTGNPNCFFGIPDVISSNEAPVFLREVDPLCLVSEEGELAIEQGNYKLHERIPVYSREELARYWNCKFYLHNTPHATAAFLGKLFGVSYLHEAMSIPLIEKLVKSTMESTQRAMKTREMAEPEFIDYYAQKEIQRFKDKLLFDPVARVGREPLRKLRGHDRLIQSAKFIEAAGQDATGAYVTIKAAIYDAINNPSEIGSLSIDELNEVNILKRVSGLNEEDKTFREVSRCNIFQMLFQSFDLHQIVHTEA